MKTRSPFALALAFLLCLALVVPPDVAAQAGQRAGQVSRVVPTVNLQRGSQQMAAAAQTPVFWEDVVNTLRLARARIALDDGSVLNVGSESSLRIVKHDAAAQQTQLELTYGRVRSKTVNIARPGGNFDVRTPVGVAGVVGTDFYVLYLNALMLLIVFEGKVRFCNLSGQCVDVLAGMTSTIRGDQQPDPPRQATPSELMEAAQSTDLREPSSEAAHHSNSWMIIGLVVLAAVPAIALPLTNRKVAAPPPAAPPCIVTANRPCP